jgi:VanZ family protein
MSSGAKASALNLSFLNTRDFLWYWLPPLAWCGTVLLLSGDLGSANNTGRILTWLLSWFPPLSPAQFKVVHFYFRKMVGHFGNYACLYFLWFRALRGQLRSGPWRAFCLAIAFCLALALLDEGRQTIFPSRTPSLWDVVLDLSGASVGALVTWLFWPRRVRLAAEK